MAPLKFRSFKVVASGGMMLAILVGAELSQAVAEGFLVAEENEMTGLVNRHRSLHGSRPLQQDAALQMVARRQAQRMAAAGYIYHTPDLAAEAGRAVPNWVRIGENVGIGPSVVSVQDAFLASPPHHDNIDKPYNLIGLGAVAGNGGALFFTQNFAQTSTAPPPAPTTSTAPTTTTSPTTTAPSSTTTTAAPLAAPPPLPSPPPPPPPAVRSAAAGPRMVCRRRGRRMVCRRTRPRRTPARARRGRRARVRGVEVFRPTPDAQARTKSKVTFLRTVVGMLDRAAEKMTFWD
jgi:hypothetical protein